MLIVLQIERLVGGGAGLAHHGDATWMIRGGLPGEEVEVREVRRRAGVVEGQAVRVLGRSHPARLGDPCPHADACGGCDWPHVDPALGAKLKAVVAAGAARAHPALAEQLAAAPVTPSPPAYRLRSRLHWQPQTGLLGFYGPRSRQVTAISHCRIISPRLLESLPPLTGALQRCCPQPVDLEWLESLDGSAAVAALRPSRSGPPRIDPAWLPAEDLGETVGGCHLLVAAGKLSAGWGASEVTMALPVPLQVPVGAFFQVNRHLVGWLFARVCELIGPQPLPVWDLYGGVGFLAAAAWHAAQRQVTIVETFRPAARAAAGNLPAARVAGRTAEAYLARHRSLPAAALVLTDPPRAGMSQPLRRAVTGWRPQRLLMLACDPATWTRDCAVLLQHGYRLANLELVDLFPSTSHVEILAVLEAA